MDDLLTAKRMRAIERAAIESGAVTGAELMERAGRGVVEAVFAEWPKMDKGSHRAVVLCGPGNNGGDGFVVARLLTERGWEVTVYLYGDAEKLPPDARRNHERWCRIGAVLPACAGARPAPLPACDLLVDALFGTGLTRAVEDSCLRDWFARFDEAGETIPEHARPVTVAVDLPSGLDADTGQVLGAAPRVMLTVTFHGEKCGHRLGAGPEHCGRVVVADIGLEGG